MNTSQNRQIDAQTEERHVTTYVSCLLILACRMLPTLFFWIDSWTPMLIFSIQTFFPSITNEMISEVWPVWNRTVP